MATLPFSPIAVILLIAWCYLCLWSIPQIQEHPRLPGRLRSVSSVAGLLAGPVLLVILLCIERRFPSADAEASEPAGFWPRVKAFFQRWRRRRAPQTVNRAGLRLFDESGREITEIFGYGKDKQATLILSLTHEIIADAWQQRASDMLLDPKDESTHSLRFRVDGVLETVRDLDAEVARAVLNSVKAVSGMDIAERRRPQDGAFSAKRGNATASFRVASAGVLHGEKLSIRMLNRNAATFALKDVGLNGKQHKHLRDLVRSPSGMILICGPTGSGKTNTMYALINEIDRKTRNIITVEDPVEATLPNVSQIAVNTKAGITFSKALRNLLRHDPDVICLGEIRDEETAEIGLRASQTGHLVLATLHCDSNPAALIRLLDLGISPLLLTSGLSLLISQRLVRRLCNHCKQPALPDESLLQDLAEEHVRVGEIFTAVGCKRCRGTGYLGRVAIADMLELTDQWKADIGNNPAQIAKLRAEGIGKGKSSLRREGLKRVANGLTTIEEIERVVG